MEFPIPSHEEDLLEHIVSAQTYFSEHSLRKLSPFQKVPLLLRLKIHSFLHVFKFVEVLIGKKLYVRNELQELFFINSRIRSLLLRLVKKGIVATWYRPELRADAPKIINYRVTLNPIQLPNGIKGTITGSQGNGVGHTITEALIPAIAEALERYSSAVWSPKEIIKGSYVDLVEEGAVPPQTFSFFSEKQWQSEFLATKIISNEKEVGWVRAKSLSENRSVLIPAQLVYLFYTSLEQNCHFFNTSTNGLAAHTTFTQAAYRAIFEVIERDALMIFWLNKITPSKIALDSIPLPKVREGILNLQRYGFEVHIMDITTDLEVPVFCGVLIDPTGKIGVSMTAVAGYDIENSFEHLVLELTKYAHKKSSAPLAVEQSPESIRTFGDRMQYWERPENVKKISFFIEGQEKQFSQQTKKVYQADLILEKLKSMFQVKGHRCYLVDVSAKEVSQEGLCVVRAVMPELVPVYFDEREKPCGIKRLYTVPVTLGYKETQLDESELNLTPHPFI